VRFSIINNRLKYGKGVIMDKKLISMFSCEVPSTGKSVEYAKIAEAGYKAGYIVDPRCNTKDVFDFLKEHSGNINSTFYKEWKDITSKTRVELLIDQILHYATTYGTEFELGNGYVPNDNPLNVAWEKFKFISFATEKDVVEKMAGMLYSGIALNNTTVNLFIDFILGNHLESLVDTNKIANKEAQAIFAVKSGRMPNDEFGLLRALVYDHTGNAMLIKSTETIKLIKYQAENTFSEAYRHNLFNKLNDEQLTRLARIFLRYKPLFLAMKTNRNSAVINKIRRLAKKHHVPMVAGFWETILQNQPQLDKVSEKIGDLNSFRIARLMTAILERINGKNINGKMFIIRNGKQWIRENYKQAVNLPYLMSLYNLCQKEIVSRLSKKAVKIYCPDFLNPTLPISEKSFVGNYPIGTSVLMSGSDIVVGIYWRNEWGCRDYDLHYTNEKGEHIGWNALYYNDEQSVVFSGDMTNAEPEATELFLFKDGNVVNGKVEVSKYYGSDKAKFKFFIAREDVTKQLRENSYRRNKPVMVDPNNVVFETIVDHDQQGSMYLGYVLDNKFYFSNLVSNKSRVASQEANDIVQKTIAARNASNIDLKELMTAAGFEFVENPEDADLDLTTVDRSEIIKLFM